MIKTIRNLLVNIIENIDAGNSNLNEEECIEALNILTETNSYNFGNFIITIRFNR